MYKVFFFSLFLFLPLFSIEYSFETEKTEVLKREPFYVSFVIQGEKSEIEILQKNFSNDTFELRYLGIEEHTNIINFDVTRKKIVKYEVVMYEAGKIQLPTITIKINNQKIQSPVTLINVKDEDYQPTKNNHFLGNSLFDDFFSNNSFRAFKRFSKPEKNELFVKFTTIKDKIYVGEEVIGYYALYNKNSETPNFQRDVSSFVDVPFFKIDILENIKIQLTKKQKYENKEFFVTPYEQEIFLLTPLKSGEFVVGKIKFNIGGSSNFYFQDFTTVAKESKITVLPLPLENRPKYFQGGIGHFNLQIQTKSRKAYVGEPLFIKIIFEGEGSLDTIKDPLKNYCQLNKEDCINFEYNLYDINKEKVFKEITNGYFGFYSKVEYEYGIIFKQKGVSSIFHFIISFFNPQNASYETLEESLEEIIILPERKVSYALEQNTKSSNSQDWTEISLKVLFFISVFILSLFFAKQYLFFSNSVKNKEIIEHFSQWIGKKRGIVLKNFLVSQKFSVQEIEEILSWFEKEKELLGFFQKASIKKKAVILKKIKKIQEEKTYDNKD